MGRAVVTGVVSARPDGATALAISLAARLSTVRRALLIDLNLDRPEIGPLLDLNATTGLHQLSHNAKLGPVSSSELSEAVVWRDGLACLSGMPAAPDSALVTELFVSGLLDAASQDFDHVILDLGRLQPGLVGASSIDQLFCALRPSPIGLWAFDRAWRVLDLEATPWRESLRPVLNRVDDRALDGVERYVELETGLRVAGALPECSAIFTGIEYQHALRDLLAPDVDERRFVKVFGADVLAYRRAVDGLAETVTVVVEEVVGVR